MDSITRQGTDTQVEQDIAPKGALFCPNCSHQSQYNGDWDVIKRSHGSRYLCPDCRTEITCRPAPETPRSPFYTYDPWQTWRTNIRLMQKVFWI